MKSSDLPFLVNRVNFQYTRLMDESGTFHNSISIWDAKKRAETVGLQLVCFNLPEGQANAFCKIIDFGKWKYDQEKSLKKQQKVSKCALKEIYFTPNIENHDIAHKVKRANEFVADGHEVMLQMKAGGRDRGHMDLVKEKMSLILEQCVQFSKLISRKEEEGQITVRIAKK